MWPKRAGRWASSRRPALFKMSDVLPFSLHGLDVLPFWDSSKKGQNVGHVNLWAR